MKTTITLLLFLVIANPFFAQSSFSLLLTEYSTQPCEYDSSQMILSPDLWEIYQTTDEKWDGERDSSFCLNFEMDTSTAFVKFHINLSDIDLSTPLFVRYKFDDSNKTPLDSNTLYDMGSLLGSSGDFLFNNLDTCQNNLCSGLLLGIENPDSTFSNTTLRWVSSSYESQNTIFLNECIATEKFENQFLRECIYKFSFKDVDESEAKLQLSRSTYFENQQDNMSHLIEIAAKESNYNNQTNTYDVPIYNVSQGFGFNHLVLHNDTTYPSLTNQYYVEAFPISNPQEKAVINLIIELWESLHFQPFTNLRGALVEGNDSIRHEFNLINNGGNICAYSLADLVFDNGNSYTHNDGEINFSGQSSCMMFRKGGTLEIGEETTLNYGSTGKGVLLIGKNSTIKFGKDSKLVVDNHFKLWETSMWPDEQVYIDLQEGNELIFGEYAKLSKNTFQENGHMKLNVYMNGGILDDSNLTAEERQLINRIYPEEVVEIPSQMEVQLFPNPTKEDLQIEINSPIEGTFQLAIFSLDGKLLSQQNGSLNIGKNQLSLSTSQLERGMYFVKISSSNGKQFVRKIIKQ